MQSIARRIIILLSLILAVGAALIAYQQTQRVNEAQVNYSIANATVEALGTQVVRIFQDGDATLAAIAENAEAEIDDVRSAASTLQAGSLGTRTALETEIDGLESTVASEAQSAATLSANAEITAVAQADFATEAAATQAAQVTLIADLQSDLQQAQATGDSLQSIAAANAERIETQEAELQTLLTQVALADAATPDVVTVEPTTRVAATATTAVAASTNNDARTRRDDFLETFPRPLLVGETEWAIVDDPEFQFDLPDEASVALLLTNDAGERAILNVYFGTDADRYVVLAEQAVPALSVTPFATQPEGFPTPSIFGQNPQAYEAIWVQETILARVTLLTNESDGETTLIAFARRVLELLGGA